MFVVLSFNRVVIFMEEFYAGLKQLLVEEYYRYPNRTLISLIGKERFARDVDYLKSMEVLVISDQTSENHPIKTDFRYCHFQSGRLEGISRGGTLNFHNQTGMSSEKVLDIIPVHTLRLSANYEPDVSLLKRFTFTTGSKELKKIDIDAARAYIALSTFGKPLMLEYIENIRRGME